MVVREIDTICSFGGWYMLGLNEMTTCSTLQNHRLREGVSSYHFFFLYISCTTTARPGNINFIKIYDNIFSPSKVFLRDGKDPLSDVNKIGVYLLFFPGNRWTSRRARCSRLVSFIMYVTLNHKNNTSKIYPI